MESPTYERPKPTLSDLSDYALLHIFSYLNSTDLFQLSRTCKRIDELINDKMLWIRVDARDQPINTYKVDFCLERMNARTTSLYFAANCRSEQILPNTFLHENICSNLRILALENQMVRGDLLSLSDYPPTLTEISFRKSFIVNYQSFFRYSNKTMKNLKVLVLDECGWVESDMVMPFSKYPKLEVLSLYMCKKLSDNAISYLSLAACYGFKNLRILDVRFTGLGDQVLKAFYKHKTLQELYFQAYASTYKLEKTQRELELAIGSQSKRYAYPSIFDDIPDTNLVAMGKMFGKHTYKSRKMQNVSDDGVVMYKFVEPDLTQEYHLDSILYERPYRKCTCGFYEDNNPTPTYSDYVSSKDADFEVKKDEIARLEQIIAQERRNKAVCHLYMLKPKLEMDSELSQSSLEDYDSEANESNKVLTWMNVREPQNEYEIAMLEHTDLHFIDMSKSSNIIIDFRSMPGSVNYVSNEIIIPFIGNGEQNEESDEINDEGNERLSNKSESSREVPSDCGEDSSGECIFGEEPSDDMKKEERESRPGTSKDWLVTDEPRSLDKREDYDDNDDEVKSKKRKRRREIGGDGDRRKMKKGDGRWNTKDRKKKKDDDDKKSKDDSAHKSYANRININIKINCGYLKREAKKKRESTMNEQSSQTSDGNDEATEPVEEPTENQNLARAAEPTPPARPSAEAQYQNVTETVQMVRQFEETIKLLGETVNKRCETIRNIEQLFLHKMSTRENSTGESSSKNPTEEKDEKKETNDLVDSTYENVESHSETVQENFKKDCSEQIDERTSFDIDLLRRIDNCDRTDESEENVDNKLDLYSRDSEDYLQCNEDFVTNEPLVKREESEEYLSCCENLEDEVTTDEQSHSQNPENNSEPTTYSSTRDISLDLQLDMASTSTCQFEISNVSTPVTAFSAATTNGQNSPREDKSLENTTNVEKQENVQPGEDSMLGNVPEQVEMNDQMVGECSGNLSSDETAPKPEKEENKRRHNGSSAGVQSKKTCEESKRDGRSYVKISWTNGSGKPTKRKENPPSGNTMSQKKQKFLEAEDVQPGPSGINRPRTRRLLNNHDVMNYNLPGPSGDSGNSSNDAETLPPSPDPGARAPERMAGFNEVLRHPIRILLERHEMKTTAIKYISLRGYRRVTDVSLYYLSKFKLELLDVTQTSVTKKGVSDFVLRNPQCRVVHESACVCRPRMHF